MRESRSLQNLNILGFGTGILSLLIAYFFMEKYLGLAPCPLCWIDRFLVLGSSLLFLLSALHSSSRGALQFYAGANLVLCSLGVLVTGRHIWLQSLPPEAVPGCTPDLSYMWELLPLPTIVERLFNSAGECAEVSWTFLGLSIPQQTLVLFIVLGLLALVALLRVRSQCR